MHHAGFIVYDGTRDAMQDARWCYVAERFQHTYIPSEPAAAAPMHIYHAFNTLGTHTFLFQVMVAFLSYINNACHSLSGWQSGSRITPAPCV